MPVATCPNCAAPTRCPDGLTDPFLSCPVCGDVFPRPACARDGAPVDPGRAGRAFSRFAPPPRAAVPAASPAPRAGAEASPMLEELPVRSRLVGYLVIGGLALVVLVGLVLLARKANHDSEDRRIVEELKRVYRLEDDLDELEELILGQQKVLDGYESFRVRSPELVGAAQRAQAEEARRRLGEMERRRARAARELAEAVDDLAVLYGRERVRRLLAAHRAAIRRRK